MKRIYFLILFIVVTITGLAQHKVTSGNLVRINFHTNEIDFTDTLWNWTSTQIENEYKNERCIGGFKLNDQEYLLITKSEFNQSKEWYSFYLLNVNKKIKWFLYERPNYIDANQLYLYFKPKLLPINNGTWILFGIDRAAVFFRSDSLNEGQTDSNLKLIHVAGPVGRNHLAVLQGAQSRLFLYEIDLNNSPEIKLVKPIEKFNNTISFFSLPRKVHHLFDSLYIFKNEFDVIINLVSFSNDKFTFLKKLKPEGNLITAPDFITRFFIGRRYYYLENRVLFRETFNLNTLAFENKTPVLYLSEMYYNIDTDSNYIAYYRNDSLFVYSIDKEEVIYKQSIAPIKNFIPGFLSPPYIYFHQVKTITDISGEENYPAQFILLQNYPNPFNPSTTIEYVVPNILPKYSSLLQHVTLTIYNVLGKEIALLVDEVKLPGKYSVQFTPPSKISSTVYFYQIKISNFIAMKKMIFLK